MNCDQTTTPKFLLKLPIVKREIFYHSGDNSREYTKVDALVNEYLFYITTQISNLQPPTLSVTDPSWYCRQSC